MADSRDDLDALKTQLAGQAGPPPAGPTPPAGASLPPDQLPTGYVLDGRLMVVRKIGEGGMGVVYEVIDTRTQARYAVKLLNAALAQDADAVDLMAREVAAAQAVTHQNLLKVNYFADSGPYKYLVMEFLGGADLATHLARRGGRLACDEALGIARQVAAGLDHLHERGLVHLDVKPQNVFVSAAGEVQVLDYGISRIVRVHTQAAAGAASSGTLAYMAPEQLRGEAVDRRADVYAFGLMLAQLLTGALPFDPRSKKEVVAWHVDARHQTPTVGDEKLDGLIAACLSVDPAKRPLSLARALVAPSGESSAVSHVPPIEKQPRRSSVWKWVLGGGLVVASGIGAWLVVAGRTAVRPTESAAVAVGAPVAPSPASSSGQRTDDSAAQAEAERDFAQYKSRCDAGDLRGCVELGALYEVGRGVLPDVSQARDLFVRACDGGNLRGCARLGRLYWTGRAVAEDFTRARQLFVQACDGGELLGCSSLGSAYAFGDGVAKDFARARQLFRQACDGGEMRGCSNLGTLYDNGQGVPQDYAQSRQLYEQSCNGGGMRGCFNLGLLYNNGQGVPQDYARARHLYGQACNGGEMVGCSNLGTLNANGEGVPQDYARAQQLYEQACNGGEMGGCNNLGTLYANGEGVPQDYARARQIYEQACNGGEMLGCNNLGRRYDLGQGVPQDYARARQFYEQACNGGEMEGCSSLGTLYANGEGVPQDYARARQLLTRACDAGLASACSNLTKLRGR